MTGEGKCQEINRYIVKQEDLPANYPTHMHDSKFWESLGRAIATYGFLEEVLGKAIFVFTGTRRYKKEDAQKAYEKWITTLEHALYDPLGKLIPAYKKAVEENPEATIGNLEMLIEELKKAKEMRNILCHGSWRKPDKNGAALPFFVNTNGKIVETAMDIEYLNKVQKQTAELICAVINTVTHMGWQFPGSNGPGTVI